MGSCTAAGSFLGLGFRLGGPTGNIRGPYYIFRIEPSTYALNTLNTHYQGAYTPSSGHKERPGYYKFVDET